VIQMAIYLNYQILKKPANKSLKLTWHSLALVFPAVASSCHAA
jgi:hypothetical protein